jgi:hypothetical protein
MLRRNGGPAVVVVAGQLASSTGSESSTTNPIRTRIKTRKKDGDDTITGADARPGQKYRIDQKASQGMADQHAVLGYVARPVRQRFVAETMAYHLGR